MGLKRITILCQEFPYPANYGGAIDTWNRIIGLKKLGHSVQLLVWSWKSRSAEELDYLKFIREQVDEVVLVKRSYPSFNLLLSYPIKMLSFKIAPKQLGEVKESVEKFRPDFFLLDSWGPYLALLQVKEVVKVPYYYRSHNIEFLHYKDVFSSSSPFGRIKIYFNLGPMEKMEIKIRKEAHKVFDICEEDQDFWKSFIGEEYSNNSRLLYPTFIQDTKIDKADTRIVKEPYILYVGSLWTQNNIRGLLWFMDYIARENILQGARDHDFGKKIKIVFAGSMPDSRLSEHILVKQGAIRLLADISEAEKTNLMSNAELFINPVQKSQGINIKMIEMLHYNKPIVSTIYGTRGLPEPLKQVVFTSNDPQIFIQHILEILMNQNIQVIDFSEILNPYFQVDQLKSVD